MTTTAAALRKTRRAGAHAPTLTTPASRRKRTQRPAPPRPPSPAPARQVSGHLAGGHSVAIFALTRPTHVTAQLAEAGAKLTAGFGKWEEIAVPRGQAFTQWVGGTLKTMAIELLLDGWHSHRSVERTIAALEQLAVAPGVQQRGGDPVTPSPVRIVGAVPHPELTWVVTGIDFGDQLRDFATGARLRQALTLHLMEYVAETTVGAVRPAAAPRKYKVKRGDDLKKLATRFLGRSSRWPEIVKLNKGLRGWQLASKMVGKTILIPAH